MDYAVNWEVLIIGGGVLIGFVGVIIRPILKLNTTLTTLDLTIKSLQELIRCNKTDNDKEHDEIFEKLDEHEDALVEHDKAISELRMTALPFDSKR